MKYLILILIILAPIIGSAQIDKIPIKQLDISAGQGLKLNGNKFLVDDQYFGDAATLSVDDILGDLIDGDGINIYDNEVSVLLSSASGNALEFKQDGGLYVSNSTGSAHSLQAVTDIGSSTTNSITAAHFYRSSDIRLKKVIERSNHNNPLYIPMITYSWKDKVRGNGVQYGYSAQTVKKVYPNLVSKDNKGYLSVDYSELHTLQIEQLKKEVKELRKEIEELKMMIK